MFRCQLRLLADFGLQFPNGFNESWRWGSHSKVRILGVFDLDFLSWICEAELEPQLKEQLMDIVEFEDISRSLQIFLYFLVVAKARQGPWSWHLSHAPWGHYIVHDYWGLAVAMSSQVSKVSKSLLSLFRFWGILALHSLHSFLEVFTTFWSSHSRSVEQTSSRQSDASLIWRLAGKGHDWIVQVRVATHAHAMRESRITPGMARSQLVSELVEASRHSCWLFLWLFPSFCYNTQVWSCLPNVGSYNLWSYSNNRLVAVVSGGCHE